MGVVFYHAIEQGKNVLPNNLLNTRFSWSSLAARSVTSAFSCSSSSQGSAFTCNGPRRRQMELNLTYASVHSGNGDCDAYIPLI